MADLPEIDALLARVNERPDFEWFQPDLVTALRALRAEVERQSVTISDITRERDDAREALVDAEEVLSLVEHPAHPDPWYHAEVKALGQRIGFGALMTTASAGWREIAAANGDPTSGVFVAGPCIGTVQGTLRRIRSALTATPPAPTPAAPSVSADAIRAEIAWAKEQQRLESDYATATCPDPDPAAIYEAIAARLSALLPKPAPQEEQS